MKLIGTLAVLLLVATSAAAADQADYLDPGELDLRIITFDGAMDERMTVRSIGTTASGRDIRAVRVDSGPDDVTDGEGFGEDARKPGLLIECGIHAREWAAPEVCVGFLDDLRDRWNDGGDEHAEIEEILDHATIWVIPLLNPDGRSRDGDDDPEDFWTSTSDHPGKTGTDTGDLTGSDASGWRGNTQPVVCHPSDSRGTNEGIDIARNFSAGWEANCSSGVCTDMRHSCEANTFRGEEPFQAREARVFRKFVNNRMISIALGVHAYGQSLGVRVSSSATDEIRDHAKVRWNGLLTGATLKIVDNAPTGGGSGQIPAWLADTSNTSGYLDDGTRRGVNAYLLELPIESSNPYAEPHRADNADDSNRFHPSGQAYFDGVQPSFTTMALYLAAQARSPWCPIRPGTLEPKGCAGEIGLTGSKIGRRSHKPGRLGYAPTSSGLSAVETIAADPGGTEYRAIYRVQNFDNVSAASVDVRVLIEEDSGAGFTVARDTTRRHASILPDEGKLSRVLFTAHPGRSYRVTIELLDPATGGALTDSESSNNRHIFAFEATAG